MPLGVGDRDHAPERTDRGEGGRKDDVRGLMAQAGDDDQREERQVADAVP